MPETDRGRPAGLLEALMKASPENRLAVLVYLCGYAPDAVRTACYDLVRIEGLKDLRAAADS